MNDVTDPLTLQHSNAAECLNKSGGLCNQLEESRRIMRDGKQEAGVPSG